MKNNYLFLVMALTALSSTFWAQSNFYSSNSIQDIRIFFGMTNWDYQMDTAKAGAEGYILADSVLINGIAYDSVGVK